MTLFPTSRLARAGTPLSFSVPLGLLLITRLAVGLLYSLSVPIWEAYDEDGHFAYARYIAVYHSLLKPGDPEAEKVWEKFQPPLYYLLVAPLIAGFDLGPTWQIPPHNPYFVYGNAGYNNMLHPVDPTYADQQIDLAVRVARLFSLIVSTFGVGCIFFAARLLWPTEKGKIWAATLLYAFWPQFLFNGSMVTNDALVTALAAGVIYLALRLVVKGFRWRDGALLIGLLGASILTKLNALAFLPLAAVALGLSLAKVKLKTSAQWLALGGAGLLLAVTLGVISSLRFITQHVFRLLTVERFFNRLSTTTVFPHALPYSLQTFVGSFGWGNLETYSWLYPLWAMLAAVGLLGLVWGARRRQSCAKRLPLLLMGLHCISVFGLTLALAIANETIHLTHGRYMLTALPAVCFLLISGWQTWLPRRWQPWAWKIAGIGILLFGWSIPLVTLLPAYAQPLPAPTARLKALRPVNAILDNNIELIGYEPAEPAAPGQEVTLTLCWQALRPVEKNYTVILDIVGPDGQGYGELKTYPGRGNYATSFWKANVPFCEPYAIPIGTGMPAPVVAKVLVHLWDQDTKQNLPLTQLGGQSDAGMLTPVTIRFKVNSTPATSAAPQHATTYRFGDELVLRGYDLQPVVGPRPGVSVTLHWETVKGVTANYVVFVHLRDTPTHLFGQDDSEPRHTWYPTSWWAAGETVLDGHTVYLPAGAAPPLDLYIGVYNAASGTRLPAFDAQGNPVVNDEVSLAQNLTLP
jgi:hypothetical protein